MILSVSWHRAQSLWRRFFGVFVYFHFSRGVAPGLCGDAPERFLNVCSVASRRSLWGCALGVVHYHVFVFRGVAPGSGGDAPWEFPHYFVCRFLGVGLLGKESWGQSIIAEFDLLAKTERSRI